MCFEFQSMQVVAELLGTFLLVFTVMSALIMNEEHGGALGLLGVAVTAGLAMVVLVSSLAHVSGGHINPAVSTAMAAYGYLPWSHFAPYVAAQLLGSTAASFAAKALYGNPVNLGAIVATVPKVGAMEAFLVEFITTFTFLFVVTALATDPKAVSTFRLMQDHGRFQSCIDMRHRMICDAGERAGGSGSWSGSDDERSRLGVSGKIYKNKMINSVASFSD